MARYKQGFFNPINKHKYKGNAKRIVYRSSWELKLMTNLDKNADVIEWQSEEFSIPYRSPTNGRLRRYFPDFLVVRKVNGKTITELIEVKPAAQTRPPVKSKGRRYIKEAIDYAVNQAKWEAAQQFCQSRGFNFVVYTEKELKIV